jgi:hypothetical protein
MSNYTKATNFATKDTLPTGNSGKIVKGTEIDDEFNAIASAIGSKADTASPTFTGTPAAPTAASGTNTTQLATTAFVTAALQAVYPVGSIYINATNSTNPSSLLGFGTWEAFGAGRVMVGLNGSDADFDTAEETGGSKTSSSSGTISGTVGGTALTEAQMPKHYHQLIGANSITGGDYPIQNNLGTGYQFGNFGGGTADDPAQSYGTFSTGGNAASGSYSTGTGNGDSHTHSFSGTFSGSTQSTVQPYIVVRMWKRTA